MEKSDCYGELVRSLVHVQIRFGLPYSPHANSKKALRISENKVQLTFVLRAAHKGGHPKLFPGAHSIGGPIGAHARDFFYFLTMGKKLLARDDALKVQFTVF